MSHQNGYLGKVGAVFVPKRADKCIAAFLSDAAFAAAGTAENMRSYRSALTYWTAWLQGRYRQPLGDAPLPVAVVVQFVLDHLACPQDDSTGRTFCRLHWIRLC